MTSMRITEGMQSNRLLNDLRRSAGAVAVTQEQVSTTKRLIDASIDPLATHRALRLRQEVSQTEAHKANASQAAGWLQTTDQALDSINNIVHRARELAIQGGSGALKQSDRDALGQEITNLVNATKLAANAKFNDAYIFSGQVTDTPPYDPAGVDTYAGDTNAIVRTIGPSVSIGVNITGDTVLGDGTDGRLLNTLRDIAAHLAGGTATDINALQNGDLVNLDTALTDVLTARTTIGTTLNRVEFATNRLDDQLLSVKDFLSQAEDADMAETIIRLKTQESVYQAALSSGSRIIQPSLMDFLR